MKSSAQQSGFTLFETVIAMAIFVTAVVAVSDIFARVNSAQRRTQNIQQTSSDARFAIESIVRTARYAVLNYDYYGGTVSASGENVLALRLRDGSSLTFERSTTECSGTGGCLVVCLQATCATGEYEQVSPEDVDVTAMTFYIAPQQSPFVFGSSGSYQSNIQPRVTITMSSQSTDIGSLPEQHVFNIQTTVSLLQYQR